MPGNFTLTTLKTLLFLNPRIHTSVLYRGQKTTAPPPPSLMINSVARASEPERERQKENPRTESARGGGGAVSIES